METRDIVFITDNITVCALCGSLYNKKIKTTKEKVTEFTNICPRGCKKTIRIEGNRHRILITQEEGEEVKQEKAAELIMLAQKKKQEIGLIGCIDSQLRKFMAMVLARFC